MSKLWEKYILTEIFKVFFLFLGCFFFLYAMIDYSLHMEDFIVDKRIQFSHIAYYYLLQFIKRSALLIPLALLVSTLKVLFGMNARRELLALQASGIPIRKILRPFFSIAILCCLFNLISLQFFLPSSLNHLDHFREKHFKHCRHGKRKEPIHVLPLKDRSKILYQTLDKEKNLYLDVFWIQSIDEIWRMRSLSTNPEEPVGTYVDHLKRNKEGNFEKAESFDTYSFSGFRWQKDPTGKGYIPLENRSISGLFHLLKEKAKTTAYEYPQALTYFLFKCTMPLLCILVVLASAPWCLRYARNQPQLLIYAIALFTFVSFFALMDAAVILGENQIFSPYVAILLPPLLLTLCFSFKYYKTTRGALS
ncbi:MAG: LptF/LptG family permease [Verrucomicrobia bacterium]|nr:LptF/LptG family permease [Verrucomicrobiota bacterium]